jgi:Uma2 family endonuclease
MTDTLELIAPPAQQWSFTVDQYHQMIRDGVLEEGAPYELLDGQIIRKDRSKEGEDPMTVGYDHAWVIKKLLKLDQKLNPFGCHMQIQLPITLPPHHEPEPDGAIIRGTEDDYHGRHPAPEDVLCAIEVADASLRRDRVTKQRIYADAGIPQYIIINLAERTIEVYTDPQIGHGRYGRSITLTPEQIVPFPTAADPQVNVNVRDLLL